MSKDFCQFYYGTAYPTTKSGRQFTSKVELIRKDTDAVVETFYGVGVSDARAKLNGLREAHMAAIANGMPQDWKKA
jgi:hypothetical protein